MTSIHPSLQFCSLNFVLSLLNYSADGCAVIQYCVYSFIESVILPNPSLFIFVFKSLNPFYCCGQAIFPALCSVVTVTGIASHSGTASGSETQRNLIYRSLSVSDTLCTPRGADLLNAL